MTTATKSRRKPAAKAPTVVPDARVLAARGAVLPIMEHALEIGELFGDDDGMRDTLEDIVSLSATAAIVLYHIQNEERGDARWAHGLFHDVLTLHAVAAHALVDWTTEAHPGDVLHRWYANAVYWQASRIDNAIDQLDKPAA